jgi:peptide/nickel transport system substrate-binding protein
LNSGRQSAGRFLAIMAVAASLLASCAQSPASGRSEADPSSGPRAAKTLHIGTASAREPAALAEWGGSTPSSSSPLEHFHIFHAALTMLDSEGGTIAHLAQKVPSIDDGDWRLLPGGGMEVTWRLRPGLVWHDGIPLTAHDFVFGHQVVRDPELAVENRPELANISDATAIDDQTLVLTWRTQSIRGNTNNGDAVPAVPQHLLRDLYLTGDKVGFTNSPIWNVQWVGLGPYRLDRWERGSLLEAVGFDRYVLGRPRIDRLVIHYLGDANAMVANILAGSVDVITLGAQLDIGQVVVVREEWAARGVPGLTLPIPKGVRGVYLQYRDPTAPWVQDLRVRQGLIHALDREEFVQTLGFGLTSVAHYYVMPNDPVHRLAEERGVPRYPYDPARAERLFAEAGWTRGPDRLLRAGSGQAFPFELTASGGGDNVKEIEALADQWSRIGVQARANPYPVGANTDVAAERRATPKGGVMWPWNFEAGVARRLIAAEVGTAENRYRGGNYGGFSHPTYEGLYADLTNTLDPARYRDTQFQMVKFMAEELPLLPVFYTPLGLVARPGVEGPGLVSPLQPSNMWNIHAWDIN